ncbi:MAG: M3 family oligoendopeptidase [Gammaproteobacteria bacterium]|nr:M3 family oligoendopeptidase [Gammaproteobacteria bacterium]MYD80749.1 M3 family oligoendopeptidase [Gammaproteobacteria bacterium]
MKQLTGPSWDLSQEYSSPTDSQIEADLKEFTSILDRVAEENKAILAVIDRIESMSSSERSAAIEAARNVHDLSEKASKFLGNPSTFANCLLSVDGNDDIAKTLEGSLIEYRVKFSELMQPLSQFLNLVTDDVIDEYLDDERASASEFQVRHTRARRHELLSLDEENLVSALGQSGIHAWSRLYDRLSGQLKCQVLDGNDQREVGIAEAASLMQSTDDRTREDAWRAINRAWSDHEETCAASINALAGWRLEMCKRRSNGKAVHFLDAPAHSSHIKRETLDAVIDVARESRELSRRAAKALARAYGKQRIGPWDQRAPAPELPNQDASIPFDEGLEIVANAYGQVDASMGEFVRMMAKNQWIEGTVGSSKRPGAYCTSFPKSRTPRVYMTYSGSMTDITILAHELGHAFHHWAMKDLPDSQRSYGMSLAETASTFGETLVRDALLNKAESPQTELAVAWEELSAITSFLLNIPTRFEFEKNFYEARQQKPLLPSELRSLMANAWNDWYGDSLSEPDDLFWINKLHFHISGTSFYNFPYLFGYLFSQSVYQRRDQMDGNFFARYTGLLRDTGRVSAEQLAQTHLNVDLTERNFWRDTVAALEPRVRHFEGLCEKIFD